MSRCWYPAARAVLSIWSATVVEGRGTPSSRPLSSASRRSFCIMATSNQASSGSSRNNPARARSIGEPIALCVITSRATVRSTPPRSASSTPSLKASICTARLRLMASLRSRAWPASGTKVTVVPSWRRIGSTRSNASAGPPAMMAKLPASTAGTLPETGAASIAAPSEATCSASARLVCGLTVLMSM